jgi:hypothetical protein
MAGGKKIIAYASMTKSVLKKKTRHKLFFGEKT